MSGFFFNFLCEIKPRVEVISHIVILGFSEWLSNYPNLIQHVIPIVTVALGNQELSLCASMALKDIAR